MIAPPPHVDLLVVGAGPTGLAAACEAARFGLSVAIVDRKPHRTTVSKALVVHARTLEALETMGLVDAVRAAGVPFAAMRVLTRARAKPRTVDLMNLDWGDTRYPYWLSLPQFETERCLEEHLTAQGVAVQWGTSFVSLSQDDQGVDATLCRPDGSPWHVRARWLVGCDGGRSPVREQATLGFDHARIGDTFVIADALGDAPHPQDHGTTALTAAGALFLVPMPEPRRWRVIAQLPKRSERRASGSAATAPVVLDAAFVDTLIRERLGFEFGAEDLTWTSQFVLRQGVARRYRAGRVFIAGDAAHLHSPVGGQGLNTGVQDAHALVWRLALAERLPGAPDAADRAALLDSYEVERRAVAAAMVAQTTRATRLVTVHGTVASGVRGFVARRAIGLRGVQNRLGRGVGMLDLRYPPSPLQGPGAGVGARLPNPEDGGRRLHDLLHATRHTVVARGPGVAADALRSEGLAVVTLGRLDAGEGPDHAAGDFDDGAGVVGAAVAGASLTLVRPDRVVSAAVATPEALRSYANEVLGAPLSAL